ncbi:MAG: ABC transporter permease, partial [Candidatus Micrarchaeota archaeon]
MAFLEFNKIYAVWLREVKRFINSKPRILGSLGQPLFFLVALGFGIGSIVEGLNYFAFIVPGIIGMTLLFTSMFAGVSIIWDREFGFLKEMLIAPMSRTSIVLGRVLGGATSAVLQGLIILAIGVGLGHIAFSIPSFFAALAFMILIACGFVGVGIIIASLLNDVEAFQLIMTFIIFPIFFLSNALFPADKLPSWLASVTYFNPLSWGVGAMRDVLLSQNYANLALPLVLLLAFDVFAIIIAGYFFNKTSI